MGENPLNVLLIEDNPGDLGAICRQLASGGTPPAPLVRCCGTLADGIAAARAAPPDVILLDLNLPDSSGLETVKAMQAASPRIPIVVLTGLQDDSTGVAAVNAGAEDYLVKGEVDSARLARILLYSVERHRTLAELRDLSTADELTGLHNRRGFLSLAARHFSGSRAPSPSCAIFFVDVDGLKLINDQHGHAAGDEAIAGAAAILRESFRPADLIGRIGGDEFAVLRLEPRAEPPESAVDRIRERVAAFNAAQPRPWKLSLSVGFSRLAGPASTLADMLEEADRKMYEAKGDRRRT